MSPKWWHPKVCGALVFCGAVAVLITVWRIEAAGQSAVEGAGGCKVEDLKYRPVHLEMARTPARVRAILTGGSLCGCEPQAPNEGEEDARRAKTECLRRGIQAQVEGDDHLLVAYSFLTFALFLFVGAFRFAPTPPPQKPAKAQVQEPAPAQAKEKTPALAPAQAEESTPASAQAPEEKRFPVAWALFALLGLAFALAMGLADFLENRRLLELTDMVAAPDGAISAVIPALWQASAVKLGALALSALVLGLLWPSDSRRPCLPCLIRVAAWVAAAFLALALRGDDAPKAVTGVGLLTVFWSLALVHAVVVAVRREEVAPAPAPPLAKGSGSGQGEG